MQIRTITSLHNKKITITRAILSSAMALLSGPDLEKKSAVRFFFIFELTAFKAGMTVHTAALWRCAGVLDVRVQYHRKAVLLK